MPKFDGRNSVPLPRATVEAYRGALQALDHAGISHAVGGAYALAHYTGVVRQTKDFDLFIHPRDRDRALEVLRTAGYRTEIVFPYWLAKAFAGEYMVDLIYRAPNGEIDLDSGWFKDGRLKPQGPMSPAELVDATSSLDDPNRLKIMAAAEQSPSGTKD